ncbi:glucosamine-6-phosphate deaminase [Marinigracilibium pacificum]|uniref:Glucosamine-6-phosphate deaminase n=1 Tax=Marinigracilibium pacificum TaxID=2729599 RepID=A0A848J3P4_9BACT|nr:glucosamine-6-phosphate deaminase [Marinigracilibium pacificum]NMM50135.1 glucosamine-6-phosphate deaminase [Marinigracilibium pacificum]
MNEVLNGVDISYKAPGVDEQTRYEKIHTVIFGESDDASKMVAAEIAELIREKEKLSQKAILGLATGSTPKGVYSELIRLHKEEGLSFKNVITFNLDEYYPIEPDALQSYVRFMNDHLFDHIDIDPNNVHVPDGTLDPVEIQAYCERYEEKILELGGLDIQILGIGRTGHIGFNEPGSQINSRTRLITLDHITRIDAASDFFGEDFVPKKAITMGVGTILKAKRVILMAWGEGKAGVVKRTVEGEVSDTVPATYLQMHPNATIVIDEAAADELVRIKSPWLVGDCLWTDRMIKRAVIWLSLKLQKPILKLTDRDYNDNGMSGLIAEYGSAYEINLKLFNTLQHTITGWPGGKPGADDTNRPERAEPANKKVVIFSPHPDDDVISMGGTFIRLVDQGHDVHVAYQTSGNIAVFDEDVVRFVDFFKDFNGEHSVSNEDGNALYSEIREFINNKKPGEIDHPIVRQVKGLIRRGEAKAACRYVGIGDEKAHFLDLPFYETGLVKKKPIGEEDVKIIVDLLQKIKPHQIYAAGDLSDPHGTHRVCLTAIFRALEQLKDEDWIKDCYVWLYRGAWQEWGIEDIDMAVPISPMELMRKRKAIFKHQSQKDSAVFPGSDKREFWQRAEDRNHGLAELYDKLGMAEYEAMEAFKRYYF